MDPNIAVEQGITSAAGVMRSILSLCAVFSLIIGLAPILWGQVRVKWLVTALTSCVMFGMMSLMMTLFVDTSPVPVRRPVPTPATEVDWGKTGLLALLLMGIALGAMLAYRTFSAMKRRRQDIRSRAEQKARALDPATVARSMVPDMVAAVDEALARVALLKALGQQASRPEDADALVMVDRRIPSVMNLYLKASEASTEAEKKDLARTALGSVIEIGQMAEDARQRIAGDLRTELDIESRYISSRTGWSGGLRAE